MGKVTEALSRLRNALASHRLHAFIVPSSDPHMTEYPHPADQHRAYISGFTGSAGTAVITHSSAALWTDGRYYLQAEKELSSEWVLMKQEPNTPSIMEYLSEKLNDGDRIGVEGTKVSYVAFQKWQNDLKTKPKRLELVSSPPEVFNSCWPDRPAPPRAKAFPLPLEYSGVSTQEKIKKIREEMRKNNAYGLIVAALDEVAWVLNIRGSDIPYCPFVISYLIVTHTTVHWFVDKEKLSPELVEFLKSSHVEILPYSVIHQHIRYLAANPNNPQHLWLDENSSNYSLYEGVDPAKILKSHSPIVVEKAIKNPVELQGFRNCSLRDGAALVEFFAWLAEQLAQGKQLTEFEAAQQLLEFRKKRELFIEPSFATISGSGPNGAIIHYHPTEENSAIIDPKAMYLCDSGGHYFDGTTDITRTLHFGEPSEHERDCFTRVLQGHINLTRTRFPRGTSVDKLDAIARLPLWEAGLNYLHGTGHGVGHALCVHEPPTLISSGNIANAGLYFYNPVKPGMTVTIEPGYYEDGKFGIRIENDTAIAETNVQSAYGPFYEFEVLTYVPIQPSLINGNLLSEDQLQWINSYNQTCYEKLSPLVADFAVPYLKSTTAPVTRAN